MVLKKKSVAGVGVKTSKGRKGPRAYHHITNEQRDLLVKLVQEDGLSIRQAGKKLKVNYSTAKHIVRTRGKEGDDLQKGVEKNEEERSHEVSSEGSGEEKEVESGKLRREKKWLA